ncbi:MAG: DUF4199 domain-containing protein [Prevotella sp.]|nr:DUF4199 domain-containing protein [Prevotella sp.]
MTFDEFRQLRAYSRYDGIYLAVLWIAAFACLICSSIYQPLSMMSILITLSTPFFVAYRLRIFRKEGLDGKVSFGRAFHYCLRVFFNAAILFAIAQWAYMQYVDNGRLASLFRTLTASDETKEALRQMGMDANILTTVFEKVTPVEFASSYLVENILIGFILSIIIAAVMKK